VTKNDDSPAGAHRQPGPFALLNMVVPSLLLLLVACSHKLHFIYDRTFERIKATIGSDE